MKIVKALYLMFTFFYGDLIASGLPHAINDEQAMFKLAALVNQDAFTDGGLVKEANDLLASIENPHIRMNVAIGINAKRIEGIHKKLQVQTEVNGLLRKQLYNQNARIKQLENSCCSIQ